MKNNILNKHSKDINQDAPTRQIITSCAKTNPEAITYPLSWIWMFGQACIVIGPEIIAIYIYAGNVDDAQFSIKIGQTCFFEMHVFKISTRSVMVIDLKHILIFRFLFFMFCWWFFLQLSILCGFPFIMWPTHYKGETAQNR